MKPHSSVHANCTFAERDRRTVEEWASRFISDMRRHGGEADGSVTRLVYTAPWESAMTEIEAWMRAAGLEVKVDPVGSRFGRLAGRSPGTILTGSHVDSVVNGGAFDGTLGVVVAACAVRWLAEHLGTPQFSVEVFANCEEESSRFPANFWGTRALLGMVEPGEVASLRDANGVPIGQAMRECGLDPDRTASARRDDLLAYIEPHIEQGLLLEEAGVPIGLVEHIVGVRQLRVRLQGATGHAGTLPMSRRADALADVRIDEAQPMEDRRGFPPTVPFSLSTRSPFIDTYNRLHANPYRWPYIGEALAQGCVGVNAEQY